MLPAMDPALETTDPALEPAFATTVPALETTDPALETTDPATLPALETTDSATLPALETTDSATFPAAEAELVAVPTRLVTAALRRYQTTSRRMALGRVLLLLGSKAEEESGSFGTNGVDDALEQVAGSPCCENQLRVGGVVFELGA